MTEYMREISIYRIYWLGLCSLLLMTGTQALESARRQSDAQLGIEPLSHRYVVSFHGGYPDSEREPAVREIPGVMAVESLGLKRLAVCAVEISPDADQVSVAKAIQALPSVRMLEHDMKIRGGSQNDKKSMLPDPQTEQQESLDQINVAEAWKTTTGSRNVIVCIVDTGIDVEHEDLKDNIWVNQEEIPGNGVDDDLNGFVDDVHGYDFHNGDSDPADDHSHGTHIAGIVGAAANNSKGIVGVSPVVSLMACKALDMNLSGLMSNSVKCLDYCLRNGADILTFSWGTFVYSQTMDDAIRDATAEGALIVASAGNRRNNNDARPYYPACFESETLITVASIDAYDRLSSWSNYGKDCVDIAAPGDGIVSTFPAALICGSNMLCSDPPYAPKWGTSQAVPHVAGAAALLKAANPDLSFSKAKELLLASAAKLPSLKDKCASEGKLDVGAALKKALRKKRNTRNKQQGKTEQSLPEILGLGRRALS